MVTLLPFRSGHGPFQDTSGRKDVAECKYMKLGRIIGDDVTTA
jgi:hypothetical protein